MEASRVRGSTKGQSHSRLGETLSPCRLLWPKPRPKEERGGRSVRCTHTPRRTDGSERRSSNYRRGKRRSYPSDGIPRPGLCLLSRVSHPLNTVPPVAALSAKLAALLPKASGFGGFQGSSSKMNEGGIGAPRPRRRERGMRQKRTHLRGPKEGEGHSKQG